MSGTTARLRPLLSATLALLVAALAQGCLFDDSDPSPTQIPTPTPPLVAGADVAFIDADNNLALMTSAGTDVRVLTEGGGVSRFDWSSDGALGAVEAVVGSGTELRIIRPDGSVVFRQTGASNPIWAPDASKLAFTAGDGIQVVDGTGAVLRSIGSAVRPAWSPDSARIAAVKISGGLGTPVIVDIAGGAETVLSPSVEPHEPEYAIAWHPAGLVIAYRNKVYEPGTGTERDIPGTAVNWSPDGRSLMIALPEPGMSGGTVFRLLDATQDLKEVIGLELPPSAEGVPGWQFIESWTDWTPDGRYLVYMDPTVTRERVRIYDTLTVTQGTYRNIKGEQPQVSPDGTVIAFMDTGRVWMLPITGTTLNAVIDGGWPDWVRKDG